MNIARRTVSIMEVNFEDVRVDRPSMKHSKLSRSHSVLCRESWPENLLADEAHD